MSFLEEKGRKRKHTQPSFVMWCYVPRIYVHIQKHIFISLIIKHSSLSYVANMGVVFFCIFQLN